MARGWASLALILSLSSLAALAQPLPVNPVLQQLRALSPQDQLAAHALLATWGALEQAEAALDGADSGAREAIINVHQQQAQRQLAELVPLLDGAGAAPAVLQEQLAAALAADLAAAAAAAQPRAPSRLAHALTLVNICWFLGCVLLVVAVASLVGIYLAALVMLVPLPAWEALGYLVSAYLVHRATHTPNPAAAPFLGLTGLLLFTSCVGGTIALHRLADRIERSERAAGGLCAFFAAAYGAVAVRLQAPMLGTLAVWWAMSALGFSIAVFPFLTVIGFRSGLRRPFAAALALVLAFLPFKVAPGALPTPAALRPFEQGVWLWCTLVMNVANLIMAHRKWELVPGGLPDGVFQQIPWRLRLRLLARAAARFTWGQLPGVAVIGGTLACGVLLDVEQCRAVGAVFGFLWLLSKLAGCNWQRVGIAWSALALGAVLWAFSYAVHSWPHMFMLGRSGS